MKLAILLVLFLKAESQEESSPKFFLFATTRRPRPTSSVVSHAPGVPPGWTRRPGRWFVGDEISSASEVGEIAVESQALNVSRPTHAHKPEPQDYPAGVEPPEAATFDKDKNLVEWVLNLFGGGNNKPGGNNNNNSGNSNGVGVTEGATTSAPVRCQACSCGVSYKQTRIVGGVVTKINAYPWMAYLKYNGRFYCGAALINDLYVLTAGHCTTGFSKDGLKVVFLDHDRSTSSETTTISRNVDAILRHPNYNVGASYNNDIALLRLNERVALGGLLKPVCLPKRGETFTGYTGIVTGWGATESHGGVSAKLREVSVPILSLAECRRTGYDRDRITENMLCAGYPAGAKDSCQGDSGGPLHVTTSSSPTNVYAVAGIVSWGEGCALENYPGVYTRVNRYITWIESNTKGACFCS